MTAKVGIQSRLLQAAEVQQRRQTALRRLAMHIDDARTARLRFSHNGALIDLNPAAEALLGRDQRRAAGLQLSGDWLTTLRRDGWIELTTRKGSAPLLLAMLGEESGAVHTALATLDSPCEVLDDSLQSFVQEARKTAHDFNNVLSTVAGYAELALMLGNDTRIKHYLQEIFAGGKRGQALVKEFQLRLVQGDLARPGAAVVTTTDEPHDNGVHVLVVDDDTSIADLLADMLRSAGYRVTTCYSAREALAVVHGDPSVALLLTDFTMPEINGTQLAKEALAVRPELPFILCTGWGDAIAAQQTNEVVVRNLIAKPIETDALLRLVRKLAPGNERAGVAE